MSRRACTLIVAGLTVVLAASACSPAQSAGILQGHLYGVGGPAPGIHQAWPGTVTVSGPGVQRDIPVAADGAYSMTLAPGQYVVVGHSPRYDDGKAACRAADDARVPEAATVTVDVLCQLG